MDKCFGTTQLARLVLIRISVLIILTQWYKCTFSTQKVIDPYSLLLLSHHRKSMKMEAVDLPAESLSGICANKKISGKLQVPLQTFYTAKIFCLTVVWFFFLTKWWFGSTAYFLCELMSNTCGFVLPCVNQINTTLMKSLSTVPFSHCDSSFSCVLNFCSVEL